MNRTADVTELLARAILAFAAAVEAMDFAKAERFAAVAFVLDEGRSR